MGLSPDVHELLALARHLADAAGALLLDGMGRTRAEVSTKSSVTDMVSEMDRAAEELIVTGLRAARPDDAILAEEGTADAGTSGVRWIVDPLDGTTNYLYGLAGFAVSIAAEHAGRPLLGVVADPVHAEVFHAVADGGAYRNDVAISASSQHELSDALVATGFSYQAATRAAQARVLTVVLPKVRDIRRNGSAAVDLCSVACGRVDAYYERGLQPWDLAAGHLIAQEAGARSTDLAGGPGSPRFMLAAAPGICDEMAALLQDAGAAA